MSWTICQHQSATSLIVIQRLFKIFFFTASMFSSVGDVLLGQPGWASSLICALFLKIALSVAKRSLLGHVERNFCSQKLKRFGFNRTVLGVTQPKLHSMFCGLFLKIALSATERMSFGLLGAAIWHRWIIISGVPSKTSVTPTSQK